MVVDAVGGRRTYRSGDVPLDPDDVLQITRNPNGSLRGTSALSAYAANLSAAFQADVYAADIVGGGGVPPAVIKSARRLTSDQAADVQAQWTSRVTGRGTPAVLPPDLDFEQLAFSPKDLMLLESREYDAKQIAAAFGVPAPLLNMTLAGGLTYANPSALFDLWWRSELAPGPARAIEEALGRWLPRGSWVEFDASGVTKPDLAGAAATWISLLQAGIVTEDEVRAAVLDLPPLAQGEALDQIDEPAGAQTSIGSEPEVVTPEPTAPSLEVVG
jgi:HK97 family phage portal protein